MPKSIPSWVPREDPNKPETTGFVPVSSSWIAGLKYTPERGTEMTVKKGGKTYPYPGFNLSMFRNWVKAQSKGKFWWRHVGYPMRHSRWTGPVHPLFDQRQTGVSPDGPITWDAHSEYKEKDILDKIHAAIGQHITPQHLAALVGWLPGTKTHAQVGVDPDGRDRSMEFTSSDGRGNYLASRGIVFPEFKGNPLSLHNNNLDIPNKSFNHFKGVSGPAFLRQVRAAYEVGIPKVHLYAAWKEPSAASRGHGYSGGLHWPMLGADGYLPYSYMDKLPDEITQSADEASGGQFSKTRQIQHFFMSPKAKEYYADNPTSHISFVDTTPGSYSRKAMERHVTTKALQHGLQPPTPDEHMPKAPLQMVRKRRHHNMSEHLIITGNLHPDYYDEYFEN